jgi:hypothetical protein
MIITSNPFSFKTWPGIHDVVATGNSAILIMHDLDFAENPDLASRRIAGHPTSFFGLQ